MECTYVEFVQGSLSNRNRIVPLADVKLGTDRNECYRSLFLFTGDLKDYVARTGSAAGYKGPHAASSLVFDFDCADDLEKVRDEAVSFIRASEVNFEVPIEYWRIAFSGSKGFHLSLPIKACGTVAPSERFSDVYKAVCCELALGYKYADFSIYQLNRVLRLPGSMHAKTGLFKTPLTFTELTSFSSDAIRDIARRERTFECLPASEIEPLPPMVALWQKQASMPTSEKERAQENAQGDGEELFAPASNGERNNKAISIAGRMIHLGLSEAEARSFINSWNRQNAEPLPEAEVRQLVHGAYRRYAKNAPESADVHTLEEAEAEYERVVDTPDGEKIRFGLPSLDRKVRAFSAGMVCSLVAKSSNGKSSFVQSVLVNHARRSGRPVLFFSLEMPLSLVYERLIQSETCASGFEVERSYRTNRQAMRQKAAAIRQGLSNFFVCTKCGLTLEDITQTARHVERRAGERASLLAIDYLSLLGGKGRDVFERTAVNAIGLKQLAKALSVPVIFLAQTTKSNTIYDRLDQNAGKDASSILEASDFQLTLWREQEEDERLTEFNEWIDFKLCLTKNRNGQQGVTFDVRMNKMSLKWEERSTISTQAGSHG